MKTHSLQRLAAMLSAVVAAAQLSCHAAAEEAATTGWQNTLSGYRYLLADGTYAACETEIDGVPYLFAPNGILQLGWQTVDDLRYFYTPGTHAPYFGWLDWRGGEYYITEEAGKSVGFTQTDRGLCYFDAYGVLHHGWLYDIENQHYYAGDDGVIVTGAARVDSLPYLFDENGVQQLGWQEIDGKRYYFNPDGTGEYQWLTIDGATYYLTAADGALTGEQSIDGMPYVFDTDGRQLLGWYTCADGAVMYFDTDGEAVTGLQSIDGALYYFSNDYRMQTGFQSIADAVYYFAADGSLQTGFISHEGNRYYSDTEGILQSGWVTVENQRYYCDQNGMLLTGWQNIDGMDCYFSPMGMLLTGWQTIDGARYYFAEDGAMVIGWCDIEGTRYYFNEDGTLAVGWCDIEGTRYYFNEDGTLALGWCDIEGTKYYFNEDGTPSVGWQLLEGSYYYFGTDGAMAVSSTVDGYLLDENGAASTATRAQVAALLDAYGTTPAEIYAYTTSHYRYKRIEDTRSFAQLEAAGWDTLVDYTLANRQGVCYYLAATTDYFLQLAGHTTRIVYAHSGTGDHYWCQVWNGSEWRNYDPTYQSRCNLSLEQLFAIKQYTIFGYAEITYNERGDYMGLTYTAAN